MAVQPAWQLIPTELAGCGDCNRSAAPPAAASTAGMGLQSRWARRQTAATQPPAMSRSACELWQCAWLPVSTREGSMACPRLLASRRQRVPARQCRRAAGRPSSTCGAEHTYVTNLHKPSDCQHCRPQSQLRTCPTRAVACRRGHAGAASSAASAAAVCWAIAAAPPTNTRVQDPAQHPVRPLPVGRRGALPHTAPWPAEGSAAAPRRLHV